MSDIEGSGQREVGDEEEDDLLASSSSSDSENDGDGGTGVGVKENNVDTESDSSSDQMDIDDDETLCKLQEIDDKLLKDPTSYDLQVEKIQTLKLLGDLDKLRAAREKLNQVYPLSPELWMSWIQDEISLISDSEEANAVTLLFERAVKDYLSVDLWLEYAKFCLGNVGQDGGVDKCRQVFERALSACGLHFACGDLLWEAYEDFEAALLGTITAPDKIEEQEKKYISLCRRQLTIPLEGMEIAYKNIGSKIEIDDITDTAYQKALDKLKTIQPWETKLIGSAEINERTHIFKEYIDAEKKCKSNPARIICLYERAVADLPLVELLWLDYIDYVSQNLPIQDVVLETATRASRNCPWNLFIWTKYMGCVEMFTGDKEQIKEIFEKAILYCTSGEDAGVLWLKYVEFLRRRIDFSNVVEANVQLFNKTISAAEDHLLQLLEEPNDYICELILYRARTATHISKSLETAKDLWSDIFQRCYGKQFRVWLQYLILEKKYGSLKSTRKHFERGINSVQDNTQSVVDLWLSYERDFGDLKTMDSCWVKVDTWKEKMAQQTKFTSNPRENEYKLKRRRNDQQPDSFQGKRSKPGLGYSKRSEDKVDGDWKSFKVPIAPQHHQKTRSKVEANTGAISKSAVKTSIDHRPADEKEFKIDPKNNDKTAFLSNLSYSTGEDAIREFLKSCGTVNHLKLVKDFQGRSKGYAYITFSSQEDVKRALEKDREPLEGRPVFISECDPDKSNRTAKFKFATGLEKNKLFVKGLPLTTTADHLQALFGAFGKVTNARIITFRNGHSKGMAYVDFLDVESATVALEKTDGKEFEGNILSVAVSNPPKRTNTVEETLTPALVRRTAKPFVPRSLQIKSDPKPEKSVPGEQKVNMSNQEFRNFFLKPAPAKPDA